MSPPDSGRGYRADIDGLRAVAVLGVVIFHLNSAWLPGGYVGVDIFFVISGFLITGIVWSALDARRFSFADFYLRRIRRILPPFFVMTAVTLAAGAWLLLPADTETLARSARYAVFSAANIYYRRHLDVGYFAASSDEQPLLHTWSLGVEEQFYLVWPALLVVIAMLGRHRVTPAILIACVLAVASFWMGEAMLESDARFAYFMLPTRAGELMMGAILALTCYRRGPSLRTPWPAWCHEAAVFVGLGLIGYSLVAFNDDTPFPGLHAIVPCLGATLTILGGARSRLATALLTPRPMVFVGLVSYSLYLWHWPILAFLRYFYGELSLLQCATAAAAMLGIAYLSYRYVEQPARHASGGAWRQAATFALVPMLLLSTVNSILVRTDGFAALRGSQSAAMWQDSAPAFEYPENCQQAVFDPTILTQDRCVTSNSAGTPARVLLWGDSHAAHHLGVAMAIAGAQEQALRNASLSSCPPVFGGHYGSDVFGKGCDAFRNHMEKHLESGAVDVVLLGATWSSYDSPGFRADLERTLGTLTANGVRVVLLEEVPSFPGFRRDCVARWTSVPLLSPPCARTVEDTLTPANANLRRLAIDQPALSYLGLRAALCRDGACSSSLEGHNLYYDEAHLNMIGSRAIGAYLLRTGQADDWRAALGDGLPTAGASHTTSLLR